MKYVIKTKYPFVSMDDIELIGNPSKEEFLEFTGYKNGIYNPDTEELRFYDTVEELNDALKNMDKTASMNISVLCIKSGLYIGVMRSEDLFDSYSYNQHYILSDNNEDVLRPPLVGRYNKDGLEIFPNELYSTKSIRAVIELIIKMIESKK